MLKVKEVAEMAGIPDRTVYHHVATGKLAAIKPGGDIRIFRRDAEEFVQKVGEWTEGDEIPEDGWTLKEVAAWLRFHPEHVRRMALKDGMPVHRTGRTGKLYFYKDEVMTFLKERSTT